MAPAWGVVKENKLISGALVVLFGLLMAWGIWVTDNIYAKSAAVKVDKETIQSMITVQNKTLQVACLDIDELKKEDRRLRVTINEVQAKILIILLDIQRDMKIANKRSER